MSLTGVSITNVESGGGGAAAGGGQAILTFAGNLTTITNPFRIYNESGTDRTISNVKLAVNTAPTGAAVIVDVLRNGAISLFTAPNRPTIAAAANEGESTTFVSDVWADGDYMQAQILQIGSLISGADLVVHIVYT